MAVKGVVAVAEAAKQDVAQGPEVTTNAIEGLNASVPEAARNGGHFPGDQAATKLIWLALRHITENRKRPSIARHAARAQLAIQFGEEFVLND